MVSASPIIGKNRLIIELSGSPTSEDLAAFEAQLHTAISRLRSPFDVLSDVRALDSLDGVCTELVLKLVAVLRQAGVRRVVRVVGRSSQGAVHMARVLRPAKVSAHLAFSREEAEALLDRA